MAASLYWYDLETFGRDPKLDRPAQFAGIRTDDSFQAVDDPLIRYCRISEDYLPDPGACLVSGITPQETIEKGIREREFIEEINNEFSKPGTCVVGYNNIKFDDEFVRNGLYRNFFDPYRREYENGNSRWDLIDLVRAMRDLRPEGLVWPEKADGRPSFRLEELTEANDIGHQNAHDAESDVRATIELARRIHQKQPKLFKYAFKIRQKEEVKRLLDLHAKGPVVHTSRIFTGKHGCTSLISPLTVHPSNRNCILAFDLREDPKELIGLTVSELRRRLFTPDSQLEEGERRIGLIRVYVNQCPFVAPVSVLEGVDLGRLGIDPESCRHRAEFLRQDPLLTQKMAKVFDEEQYPEIKDPDLQIYSGGFFLDADRQKFDRIHTEEPGRLLHLGLSFEDPRIPEMLWRYVGRNYPETMSAMERKKWLSFCAGRILLPKGRRAVDMGTYQKKIDAYLADKELSPKQKRVVTKLSEYAERVKGEILEYES
jgi:exodeoxyribonuclease I